MKKVLFATLFALTTFGFTACDSGKSSSEGSTTDTSATSAPAETTTPADTASMSADTTSAQ